MSDEVIFLNKKKNIINVWFHRELNANSLIFYSLWLKMALHKWSILDRKCDNEIEVFLKKNVYVLNFTHKHKLCTNIKFANKTFLSFYWKLKIIQSPFLYLESLMYFKINCFKWGQCFKLEMSVIKSLIYKWN